MMKHHAEYLKTEGPHGLRELELDDLEMFTLYSVGAISMGKRRRSPNAINNKD